MHVFYDDIAVHDGEPITLVGWQPATTERHAFEQNEDTMAQGIRRPHEAVDFAAIERMYPPPPEYFETAYFEDRETIERKQLARLIDSAWRAYEVPFHRDRWDAAGFHPSHLKTLDDLWKAPSYTVDDIRQSIDDHPPYGDYQGVTPERWRCASRMRVYMSGGTTGKSRPTFYTQWDRMAGAVFTARALYQLGIRPGDVVLNSWAYSTHNGALCFDEALYHWLNCVVLTTSTGNVTSTEKQVELAIQYGATAILTTGDYLLRIAEVAQDAGLRPGQRPQDPRAAQHRRRRRAVHHVRCRRTTAGTGSTRCSGWRASARCTTACTSTRTASSCRSSTSRPASRCPTASSARCASPSSTRPARPQFRYNIMDLSYLYPQGSARAVRGCARWARSPGAATTW